MGDDGSGEWEAGGGKEEGGIFDVFEYGSLAASWAGINTPPTDDRKILGESPLYLCLTENKSKGNSLASQAEVWVTDVATMGK